MTGGALDAYGAKVANALVAAAPLPADRDRRGRLRRGHLGQPVVASPAPPPT
ncbi:MAG: hypothetical protein R2719_15570 [Micropruina sp.]